MKTANWRGVALGEGLPKVCVSVMGGTQAELAKNAARAQMAGAQILELRIDHYDAMPDVKAAIAACRAVREAAEDLPLLFTMRTVRDGGLGSGNEAAYEALLCGVAAAGVCDALDIELSVGEAAFARIAAAAHAADCGVVGSSHEFGAIGDVSKVAHWLQQQAALGADVCKAAVMPQSREEAFALMLEMVRAGVALPVPYAGIVMGGHGVLSRVGAQAMGSCLTFGAVGEASAPGQIGAQKLAQMLRELGEAMT